VFCFVRRYTNDEEAEEIAHEAFVRLLRVRNLERMSISVAYLLRIAENLLRRRHGRAQRYREILTEIFVDSGRVGPGHDEVDGRHCANARATDTRSLVDEIDSERLDAVLKLLTPSEQSAVRLIVCQGMDYDTAARSLGVPVSTINNWKHRALTKLKQFVEGSERAGSGRRPTAEAC
jgi:RNA polymerase sigma-70 factor (ECF subfamily)